MHDLCTLHIYLCVRISPGARGRAAVKLCLFPPVTAPLFTRTKSTSFLISKPVGDFKCLHGLRYHVSQCYAVVTDKHIQIFVPVIRGIKDSIYAWVMHICTYIYACVYRVSCWPACRARTERLPQCCFARVVACRSWVSHVLFARVVARRSRVSRFIRTRLNHLLIITRVT
jgi:hypothetical protein